MPPSQLNANIPPELDRIIAKALEKDRETRYQSAAELRADLKRLKRETDTGRTVGRDRRDWCEPARRARARRRGATPCGRARAHAARRAARRRAAGHRWPRSAASCCGSRSGRRR